jgi:hypothetical protein
MLRIYGTIKSSTARVLWVAEAPLPEFSPAAAWLDRCLARPAYRRIEAMRREADAISLPTT